jgi:L-iditol 2-dehydrogenase
MRLGERPMPTVEDGELLLRVRAVSICGSDLHYYLEGGIGSAVVAEPMVLGHEFAAEVVDERAHEYGFRVGDLVAVDPARPCGTCESCVRGHRNLCPNVRFIGAPPFDGAMTEFIAAPAANLFPVPSTFDPEMAALLEPLGVAIHALDLARLRPMETVAVLGAGPIGLLLLQVAKSCGAAEVHMVDPLAYRLQAALALGADSVHQSHRGIEEATEGRGVDVVLEATNSPAGPEHAAESVRIGGRLVLVGIPEGDAFSLTASLVRRKGLTIKLSRRMADVYPRAIRMVAQGRVDLRSLVTHRSSLSAAPEAFARQASHEDGVIKTVVSDEEVMAGNN